MKLTRFPDWDVRLSDYLRAIRGNKFVFGSFNCAIFSCGAVIAMTGTDILKIRALPNLADMDLATICAARAAEFEMPELMPLQAMRGDIVMTDEMDPQMNVALGICVGQQAMFFDKGKNLCPVNLSDCFRAWRV